MIHIGTKCSKMPCIIEYQISSGSWECAAYDDDDMTKPSVFSCEHEAFEMVAKIIITFLYFAATGSVDPSGMPKIEGFRFTRAIGHAFKEPAQHDDFVPNVDLAKQIVNKIKESL